MAAHCNCCSLLLLAARSLPFAFFFFFHSCTPAAAADQPVNGHSFLELSLGLNLSILPSYNVTNNGYPFSEGLMFAVGMQILDGQGIFFPILSSPSFNSTSNSSHSTRGFSLGFYVLLFGDPISWLYNVNLAVCAGSSGNYSDLSVYTTLVSGKSGINPLATRDGFVVPVWTANLGKPIRDWGKASFADSSSSTNILQLKDGDEVLWNVSNVGMMEMRDSGDLLIFNDTSPSSTNVVWQSSSRDTLVEGQKLTVGGELRSNDSNYLARMEKGGLVLYLNNAHFGNNMQPPPYLILPIFGNNRSAHVNASINELISTAPCSNSPAFAVLDHVLDPTERTIRGAIHLDPGSCNLFNSTFLIQGHLVPGDTTTWSFLRLENDGRLYVYSVMNPSAVTRFALDSSADALDVEIQQLIYVSVPIFSQWGPDCGVPKACGPAGVCTPGAKTPCSCPTDSYFEPVNITDSTQGCKCRARLPECTTTSIPPISQS